MLALDSQLFTSEKAKTCMPLLVVQLASEALRSRQRLNSLPHLLLIGTCSGGAGILERIRKEAMLLLLKSNQQLRVALKTLTGQ
jgi:hypothetical protein